MGSAHRVRIRDVEKELRRQGCRKKKHGQKFAWMTENGKIVWFCRMSHDRDELFPSELEAINDRLRTAGKDPVDLSPVRRSRTDPATVARTPGRRLSRNPRMSPEPEVICAPRQPSAPALLAGSQPKPEPPVRRRTDPPRIAAASPVVSGLPGVLTRLGLRLKAKEARNG